MKSCAMRLLFLIQLHEILLACELMMTKRICINLD
jgi:hypothetical protein